MQMDWLKSDLAKDIFERKYRLDENENIEKFIERLIDCTFDRNTDEDNLLKISLKDVILNKEFLFGGRILANLGLEKLGKKITYSNCYVQSPPEDNIESIFEANKKLARTFSYGGGVGIDISKLAPNNAKINNAASFSTGAISFMDIFSKTTEIIGQKNRRGALMISISSEHPDIDQFIEIKTDLNKITKANISIRFMNNFMNAVENNEDITLTFMREANGHITTKTFNARKLFMRFAEVNWDYAEPGCLFWDKINNYNLLQYDDEFEYAGVNPCAEETLPAGGSCLLGAINLSEIVDNPFTNQSKINKDKLKNTIILAIKALNRVLDRGLPLHPLEEQRESVFNYRQIGLGIMGLADMLIKLGIKYGSEKSIKISDEIGRILADTSLATSALIAKEEGPFPKFKQEEILKSDFLNYVASEDTINLIKKYGLRNSQLLTIAPTGTISTMLGVSGGIEPIFANYYTRKTVALNEDNKDCFKDYKVYTDIVKEYLEKNNLSGEEELPDYFVTSYDIDYKDRIKMQATWQKYIDASISSTVNLPNSATPEDIFNLYLLAWKSGLKGITVYREGCAREGILIKEAKEEKEKTDETVFDSIIPISRSTIGKTYGTTIDKRSACGKMYITINRDKNGNIVESFVNTSKNGICKSNIDGINRLISLALRTGVKVEEIVDQLKSINCAACTRVSAKGGEIDGMSCPDIIAKTLLEEYKSNEENIFINLGNKAKKKNVCPDCGNDIRNEGGCVICPQCGFSKC